MTGKPRRCPALCNWINRLRRIEKRRGQANRKPLIIMEGELNPAEEQRLLDQSDSENRLVIQLLKQPW